MRMRVRQRYTSVQVYITREMDSSFSLTQSAQVGHSGKVHSDGRWVGGHVYGHEKTTKDKKMTAIKVSRDDKYYLKVSKETYSMQKCTNTFGHWSGHPMLLLFSGRTSHCMYVCRILLSEGGGGRRSGNNSPLYLSHTREEALCLEYEVKLYYVYTRHDREIISSSNIVVLGTCHIYQSFGEV